ncbi:neutral zinc metallopeptidase [Tamaricihabitans halophyticus]|nr:neutral zinc metallopeptidase [Tamaricihabitans halophyticus]
MPTGRVSKVRVLIALLAGLATLTGCTTVLPGEPREEALVAEDVPGGGVDPSFIRGGDGGELDRLAATVLTDVQGYWEQTFPRVFDEPWRDLEGGYYSVDSANPRADPPPCTSSPAEVEGNAFYCPSEDVLAWDRAALLPVLNERFGQEAVLMVLAHEMGHAAQRRSGITQEVERANPDRFPTIVIEAMADCYAGAVMRWISDGRAEYLRIDEEQLDSALRALITFRDPIGTGQQDAAAHGDAFDRVSAFQDGYRAGAEQCAGIDAKSRSFTQREFLNMDDQASGGNLSFEELTSALRRDAVGYFGQIASDHGTRWQPPELTRSRRIPECAGGNQGPVSYCPDQNEIRYADTGPLRDLHTTVGDYATGTLLASRYALSALAALDQPLRGEQAQRGALCLAGAYTSELLGRAQGFALSPGDLDETVQLLLTHDYPARDLDGAALDTGFERLAAFRVGVLDGTNSCLPS